jgi:integrase
VLGGAPPTLLQGRVDGGRKNRSEAAAGDERRVAELRQSLPRVRFHDLRQSAASILLAEGVQLAEISLLVGHSELRITADRYAHLQQQTAAKAARHMDAVFAAK